LSPLAEGILASKLKTNSQLIRQELVLGTLKPDERSIAAKKKIISIFQKDDNSINFDAFDYIYVMDNSNYTTVIELAENLEQKQKSN
jgi:protein-tyrosine phosphatase